MKKLFLVFVWGTMAMSANAQIDVLSNGNVGIGVNAPAYKLHVNGKLYLDLVDRDDPLGMACSYLHWYGHNLVMGTPVGNYGHNIVEIKPGGATQGYLSSRLKVYTTPSPNQHVLKVDIYSDGHTFFNNSGNFGIGTDIPSQKLHVVGNSYFNGNVGIGITNPSQKLHVSGNTAITGNLGIGTATPAYQLHIASGAYEMRLNAGASPIIGTNIALINFWHSANGFNEVVAKKYSTASDSTMKTDIRSIANATAFLKQIKTYSYYFKSDLVETRVRDYGVLAQEIETILPELVSTIQIEDGTEVKAVNYGGFIPLLIEAVKEQQNIIENLQQESRINNATINELQQDVETLRTALNKCCTTSKQKSMDGGEEEMENNPIQQFNLNTEEMKVYQNVPNPFNVATTIQCYIPENIQKAELCVYNMLGVQLKCLSVVGRGTTTVQIQAEQLAAGVYTYLLIGDSKTSDAKQMILTK